MRNFFLEWELKKNREKKEHESREQQLNVYIYINFSIKSINIKLGISNIIIQKCGVSLLFSSLNFFL